MPILIAAMISMSLISQLYADHGDEGISNMFGVGQVRTATDHY